MGVNGILRTQKASLGTNSLKTHLWKTLREHSIIQFRQPIPREVHGRVTSSTCLTDDHTHSWVKTSWTKAPLWPLTTSRTSNIVTWRGLATQSLKLNLFTRVDRKCTNTGKIGCCILIPPSGCSCRPSRIHFRYNGEPLGAQCMNSASPSCFHTSKFLAAGNFTHTLGWYAYHYIQTGCTLWV